MSKRKWKKNEIEEWRKEHRSVGYFNKEDSNIFVPRSYGFGLSPNWENPWAYVIIAVVITIVIVIKIFR